MCLCFVVFGYVWSCQYVLLVAFGVDALVVVWW